MNNWHDSCEVFITAPQLWESLAVFRRITRGKVTHQIISRPTHGLQHICACGKFMCTSQTLDMQGFLVELVHAPQTHFPLWHKEARDWFRQKKRFSRNGFTIIIIMIILFFYFISLGLSAPFSVAVLPLPSPLLLVIALLRLIPLNYILQSSKTFDADNKLN